MQMIFSIARLMMFTQKWALNVYVYHIHTALLLLFFIKYSDYTSSYVVHIIMYAYVVYTVL